MDTSGHRRFRDVQSTTVVALKDSRDVRQKHFAQVNPQTPDFDLTTTGIDGHDINTSKKSFKKVVFQPGIEPGSHPGERSAACEGRVLTIIRLECLCTRYAKLSDRRVFLGLGRLCQYIYLCFVAPHVECYPPHKIIWP